MEDPETETGSKLKMETWKWKQVETQPPRCHLLLPYCSHTSWRSPCIHFLITCFASLTSFWGLATGSVSVFAYYPANTRSRECWKQSYRSYLHACEIEPKETIICFVYYCDQNYKWGKSGNKIARVGTPPALFQDQVYYHYHIVTRVMPRLSHRWTRSLAT